MITPRRRVARSDLLGPDDDLGGDDVPVGSGTDSAHTNAISQTVMVQSNKALSAPMASRLGLAMFNGIR
jgi:hypothetical protein